MRPILMPLLERGVRHALLRSGFSSSMVSTELGRLHLYDAPGRGAMPTAVVLHGLSSAATAFAPLLARLRGCSRRVVALDYPGHGFSDDPGMTLTPDALFETASAVLDDVLRDEPCVLIGNSLGGAVAVTYALREESNVRALVLLSPAGATSTLAEWDEIRDAFAMTSRKKALAFLDRVYHRTPLIGRILAHEVPASASRPAVRDLLAHATDEHGIEVGELSSLDVPVLFWWGRSERLLPPSQLNWWKEHLPAHAVVEEPNEIGHCPHLDDPKRLAQRISAFLGTVL